MCQEDVGFGNNSHSKPEVGESPSGLRGPELAKFQRYLLTVSLHAQSPTPQFPAFSPPTFQTRLRDHTRHTRALASKKCPVLPTLGEALASSSLTQCFVSTHSALGKGGALPECCPPAPDPASPGDTSSSMGTCWSALHTRPPGLGQASKGRRRRRGSRVSSVGSRNAGAYTLRILQTVGRVPRKSDSCSSRCHSVSTVLDGF